VRSLEQEGPGLVDLFVDGASLDRVSCATDWRGKVTTVIAAPAQEKATCHTLGSSRQNATRSPAREAYDCQLEATKADVANRSAEVESAAPQ
jgi:hypothetical protein